jgi:23S rRNA (cytosine1962-C5)-methyltransferase
MGRVILKPHREVSVRSLHPWIYSGAVRSLDGDPSEGSIVDVVSAKGEYLGRGHYSHAGIAVKLLTTEDVAIDKTFWSARIAAARRVRSSFSLPSPTTDAYRLINAEGDGLPGLIIDIYGTTAVIQTHSRGMALARAEIGETVRESFAGEMTTAYFTSILPGGGHESGYIYGDARETTVKEHGHTFRVQWEAGQKTGFFLDQRENRRLLGSLSAGKRVLNTFCFTGGFSVYAAAGGAASVVSVDSSVPAMTLLDEHMALNGCQARSRSHVGDCFDYLSTCNETFDHVVVDPPAFAKHMKAIQGALRGYERLNALAIPRVAPGGMLWTFSCSGVVTRGQLWEAVSRAFGSVGRTGKILQHLSHPPCHPIGVGHPEGEYLKGFLIEVGP